MDAHFAHGQHCFEENIWMRKKVTPIFLKAHLGQLILAVILLTASQKCDKFVAQLET